jgi:hypothetical protein
LSVLLAFIVLACLAAAGWMLDGADAELRWMALYPAGLATAAAATAALFWRLRR